MELPIKLIDYPTCIRPPKSHDVSQEQVDDFVRELSDTLREFDVEIVCAKSLIE